VSDAIKVEEVDDSLNYVDTLVLHKDSYDNHWMEKPAISYLQMQNLVEIRWKMWSCIRIQKKHTQQTRW